MAKPSKPSVRLIACPPMTREEYDQAFAEICPNLFYRRLPDDGRDDECYDSERDHDEARDMAAIAGRFANVSRDGIPDLERECERLTALYPRWWWTVEQSQFDVTDDEAEFAIFVWGPIAYGDDIKECEAIEAQTACGLSVSQEQLARLRAFKREDAVSYEGMTSEEIVAHLAKKSMNGAVVEAFLKDHIEFINMVERDIENGDFK